MRLKTKYIVLMTKLELLLLPYVSNLVKKVDYDAKISEIRNKYFTPSDYNNFASNTLAANITQKT